MTDKLNPTEGMAGECQNCGIKMEYGDVEECPECCEHENTTEEPLTGERCDDCGASL